MYISKEEFESFSPKRRGWFVGAGSATQSAGCYNSIPTESNPYEIGTQEFLDWNEGRSLGARYAAQLAKIKAG